MHGQVAADTQKQDLIDLNSEDVDDAESWLLSPGAKSSIQSSPHSPQLSHRSTTTSHAAGNGVTTGGTPGASPRNPHFAQESAFHHALSQPSQFTPSITGASIDLPSRHSPPELVACHSPRPVQQTRASRIPRLSSAHGTPVPSPLHAAARPAATPSSPGSTNTSTSLARLGSRLPRAGSRLPGPSGQQVTMPPAIVAGSSASIERQSSSSTASSSIAASTGLPSPFSMQSRQHGSKPPPATHSNRAAPRGTTLTGVQTSSGLPMSPSARIGNTAGGPIPTRVSQGASRSSQAGSAMSSRSSSFRSSIPSAPNIAAPVFSPTASMPAALRDTAAWAPAAATPAAVGALKTTAADAAASASPFHAAAAAAAGPSRMCNPILAQEPSGAGIAAAESAAAAEAARSSKRRSSNGASVHLPPPPIHHRLQGQGNGSGKLALQGHGDGSRRLAPQATGTGRGITSDTVQYSDSVQRTQLAAGTDGHGGDGVESGAGIGPRRSHIPKAPSGRASSAGEDVGHGGVNGVGTAGASSTSTSSVGHQVTKAASGDAVQGQLTNVVGSIHRSGSCASIAGSTSSQAGRAAHDEQLSRKVTAVVVAHSVVMQCVDEAVQVAHKHTGETPAVAAQPTAATAVERHGSKSAPTPACCSIM